MPSPFIRPETDDVSGPLSYRDEVILNGQSQTAAVDMGDMTLVAIQIPAVWTTAGVTFLACSVPDGTFGPLYDLDGEVSVASANVVVGGYIRLDPAKFFGVRYLKLRSGTNGAPVNQAADRTLRLVGRAL